MKGVPVNWNSAIALQCYNIFIDSINRVALVVIHQVREELENGPICIYISSLRSMFAVRRVSYGECV